MDPNTPVFRYHLAHVYQALGNRSGAISELRASLDLAKNKDFDQIDSANALLKVLSAK